MTGGGTGLGSAMARRFASLGAKLTLCGRRKSPLEEMAATIREAGGAAEAVPCNVRHADRVEAAVDEAEERQGPVTALVNNAAGNFLARSEQLDARGFDAVLSINLYGGFHCTTALGRRWIERGHGGSVLSITTTYTDTGGPFVLPSAVSKAGMVTMSRTLAVEWGRHGIRLNCISPGPIPTKGAWDRLMPDPAFEEQLRAKVPLGRFATRDELGDLAVFLISDLSASVTGQVVELDGGARLAGHGSFNGLLEVPPEELTRHFEALRPLARKPRPEEGSR